VKKTDYYGPFSRKISFRQGPNRFQRHQFCLLKARRGSYVAREEIG